jgi:hypothetical protein
MHLRVGLHELDVAGAGPRGPPASEVEHRRADVDSQRHAVGADTAGGIDGQGPVPASHVGNPLARREARRGKHGLPERLKHGVVAAGFGDPLLAFTCPLFELAGVRDLPARRPGWGSWLLRAHPVAPAFGLVLMPIVSCHGRIQDKEGQTVRAVARARTRASLTERTVPEHPVAGESWNWIGPTGDPLAPSAAMCGRRSVPQTTTATPWSWTGTNRSLTCRLATSAAAHTSTQRTSPTPLA